MHFHNHEFISISYLNNNSINNSNYLTYDYSLSFIVPLLGRLFFFRGKVNVLQGYSKQILHVEEVFIILRFIFFIFLTLNNLNEINDLV